MNTKIILLADILEQKIRKEKELEYYQEQLEKLQKKMWFIKKEIEVTNMCIEIIENEKADIVGGRLLENNDNG
jgi:prefoldin subunit 5